MDYLGLSITVGIIGSLLLLTSVTNWMEKRRTAQIRDAGRKLGLEPVTQIDPELFQALELSFLLGNGRAHKLWNVMHGKVGVHTVTLFDLRYVTGDRKSERTWTQTVLMLQFEGDTLPQFAVRPESWWVPASDPNDDIDFPHREEFSRKFLLTGDNERDVRKLFTDTVLEGFEQRPGLCVEGCDHSILIYRHDYRADPEQFAEVIDDGIAMLTLMMGKTGDRHAAKSLASGDGMVDSTPRDPAVTLRNAESLGRRLHRTALAFAWFGIVSTGVLLIDLFTVGLNKTTHNDVTMLYYRQSDVVTGLCWGLATSTILWFLIGRYLNSRADVHDSFSRKRAARAAWMIFFLCGFLLIFGAQSEIWLHLDPEGLTAQTPLSKRQIRFDDVAELVLTETHSKDQKGRPQIAFNADFHRKSGPTEEWPAETIFLVEAELRNILQRRNIPLVDRAPSRFATRRSAIAEPSDAERVAAKKQYEEYLVKQQHIVNEQRHQSLHGTRWRRSVGIDFEYETTLEFDSGNTITIIAQMADRPPAKYSATFQRTGERYRLDFEDQSILEMSLHLRSTETIRFSDPDFTGAGMASGAVSELNFSFDRQP